MSVKVHHGHLLDAVIPPNFPLNSELLSERADYFQAMFRTQFPRDIGRTLDQFNYPLGSPFSAAEFRFTLLLLNTPSDDLLSRGLDVGLLPYQSLLELVLFFGSSFLISLYVEEMFDIHNAHRLIPALAKSLAGTLLLCNKPASYFL